METQGLAPFTVYMRRDGELCQRVFVTDDAQYAADFLHGAVHAAEVAGCRIEVWVNASADPTTRICAEVAHASTRSVPRRPKNYR